MVPLSGHKGNLLVSGCVATYYINKGHDVLESF